MVFSDTLEITFKILGPEMGCIVCDDIIYDNTLYPYVKLDNCLGMCLSPNVLSKGFLSHTCWD